MADESPLDSFKLALTGAARAIAREPEAEVSWSQDAPTLQGKAMRVSWPLATIVPALVSRDTAAGAVNVAAPVDGVVLAVLRESESVVPAGEPLLEIGNPERLEVVADLLSTDAVQVSPGDPVLIEQWGGGHALDARVRRVEPSGFMKVSALGVEEQRVNVLLDFTGVTCSNCKEVGHTKATCKKRASEPGGGIACDGE